MWMTFSMSRWVFLLTLAVVMLSSVSQVDSNVQFISLPCCYKASSRRIKGIKECYEQKPRVDCQHHAFMIVTQKGKKWCIRPDSQWLQDMIKKGKLDCSPDVLMDDVLA